MLKRFLIGVLCVCFVVACCFFVADEGYVIRGLLSNTNNDAAKTIIIDAGHGGLTNTIN